MKLLVYEILLMGSHFIHLCIRGDVFPITFCTNVYIHPQASRKRQCFENIKSIARETRGPWVLIGDFNEILYEPEKKGGTPVDHSKCFYFRKWVNEYGLLNMETEGPWFTWRGQVHEGFGRVYERLDCVLCNTE